MEIAKTLFIDDKLYRDVKTESSRRGIPIKHAIKLALCDWLGVNHLEYISGQDKRFMQNIVNGLVK